MVELNLLPWREQRKSEQQKKRIMELFFALLLSMILLVIAHFILFTQVNHLKARLNQTQNNLAKVNKSLEQMQALYQKFDYQKIPELNLNILLNEQRQIIYFFKKLTTLLPEDVHVQQINFEQQSWLIEGASPIISRITDFSERLGAELKSKTGEGLIKKQKYSIIKQKNGLFFFQLPFESGL